MREILIFAGTTEGRRIAECLSKAELPARVCVATEYGEAILGELPFVKVKQGRMDESEMRAFMTEQSFALVVDATHPYATLVSTNIRQAAKQAGLPYLRLLRDSGAEKVHSENHTTEKKDRVQYFESMEQCEKALETIEGNILLTTGSKDLPLFCKTEAVKQRLYVRVLPGRESLESCETCGISGSHIIAMQGPFSEELNRALLRQFQIQVLVTKESGKTGGFFEKMSACEKEGVTALVVGRPKEEGLSYKQVLEEIEKRCGVALSPEGESCTGEAEKGSNGASMEIVLAGTGMGSRELLTREAEQAIQQADYLFGAQRLLAEFANSAKAWPYYLAKDILPELDRILEERSRTEKACGAGNCKAASVVILFSGDSGFYSGGSKLYEELRHWQEEKQADIRIRMLPGISSVAAMAAACGVSWQDSAILSVHGRKDDWSHEVTSTVRSSKKTFLLVSNREDVWRLGQILQGAELSECRIHTGYRLSYPDQKLLTVSPADCREIQEEGLYTCLVENPAPMVPHVTPYRKDSAFQRNEGEGRTPMTKEEVRQLAICKLRLKEDSVVYDIGSGSGSVSVELARLPGRLQVYAVEQNPKAAELTKKNCEKFHAGNVRIIQGEAPEALTDLPRPTHAFIGGSCGNLIDILELLYRKNPYMRIVMTAVSLETKNAFLTVLSQFPVEEEEIIEVQIARSKKAGRYHLMQAENPVSICSFRFHDRD